MSVRRLPDNGGLTLGTNGKPDASLGTEWLKPQLDRQARPVHARRADAAVRAARRARARAAGARGGGHRVRLGHDVARAARQPDPQARRDDRDRAGDDTGVAIVLSGERAGVRRSAIELRDRRRPRLLRGTRQEVRPHRLGAVEPVGVRRLGPVHDRVLRARDAVSHAEWRVRAVAAPVRDRRRPRARRDRRARAALPGVLDLRGLQSRHPHRGDQAAVAARARLVDLPIAGDRGGSAARVADHTAHDGDAARRRFAGARSARAHGRRRELRLLPNARPERRAHEIHEERRRPDSPSWPRGASTSPRWSMVGATGLAIRTPW